MKNPSTFPNSWNVRFYFIAKQTEINKRTETKETTHTAKPNPQILEWCQQKSKKKKTRPSAKKKNKSLLPRIDKLNNSISVVHYSRNASIVVKNIDIFKIAKQNEWREIEIDENAFKFTDIFVTVYISCFDYFFF